MSSLKDATPTLLLSGPQINAQNKNDMSVTPDVSQVEIWPYAASAAVASENHAATAVVMVLSSSAMPATAGTKLATHRSAAGRVIVAQGSLKQALMP